MIINGIYTRSTSNTDLLQKAQPTSLLFETKRDQSSRHPSPISPTPARRPTLLGLENLDDASLHKAIVTTAEKQGISLNQLPRVQVDRSPFFKPVGTSRGEPFTKALKRIEQKIVDLLHGGEKMLQNIELRRRVNAGLNKGESKNSLTRAVFFNRLGEIRDRSYENQRYRASGLNLVVTAIVFWNTVYLAKTIQALNGKNLIFRPF